MVNVTDWVQGNSRRGELIHGFVEAIEPANGCVDVFVVASDNEQVVGNSVRMRADWLKVLPASGEATEPKLRGLVDLALALGDREWFAELAVLLKDAGEGRKDAGAVGIFRQTNRLSQFRLK